ncbi:MAG: PIN domain nuclease [Anaerolineae bacterium]|nr:PIN domain nuclease [Anaerolineae bacterium]
MSSELGLRLIGMIICALVGARVGAVLAAPPITVEVFSLIFGLVGALVGLILTPYFTTRPARFARTVIREMPVEALATALLGLIFGLVVGALLSVPLGLLPRPFSEWVPSIVSLVAAYLGILIFAFRAPDIFQLIQRLRSGDNEIAVAPTTISEAQILMDTSVIIDGRILDIARTGFVFGTILVPGFVLRQLQHIADESDPLRRNRGKRGLEILEELRKESKVRVEIVDLDTESARAVDDKLVVLAKEMDAYLMTTDHNLNRTAALQGVRVLNINELTNAVKAMLLPNEVIPIKITAEGREAQQGVGYLDDGTMVVVEDGKRYLDRTIYVTITRMIQTAAGKMYFARPEENNPKR